MGRGLPPAERVDRHSPPARYCLREPRLVGPSRLQAHDVTEVSLFVSTGAGLSTGLDGPETASSGSWPPVQRWDRACNILLALEAELEASLLELMDAGCRRVVSTIGRVDAPRAQGIERRSMFALSAGTSRWTSPPEASRR